MPAEYINEEDVLDEGRVKLNRAISQANKSEADAANAVNTSNQAKHIANNAVSMAESTQTQLDTIVIEGDSSVEAAQARVDEKGESHPTLKARIDDGFTSVTSQLSNIAISIDQFGSFGSAEDNVNFIEACNAVSSQNGTLLIRNKTINLIDAYVEEIPDIIAINSTLNVSGACEFNRSKNGFYLEGLNIVSPVQTTQRLFNVVGVDGVRVKNFKFHFTTVDANRCSGIFYFNNVKNIDFEDTEYTGVNYPITIQDVGEKAVSTKIKFKNTTFKNCKGGFWITAANVPYGTSGFISDIEFINSKGINTPEQANSYTGDIQGASMFLLEQVKGISMIDTHCESPVERIAYFNVIEDLTMNKTTGYNTEGIKIAGLPTKISKNFVIDEMTVINTIKASYLIRCYFCEDGNILNTIFDNSKMDEKPSDAFNFSCYVKNIKINNFYVDGLKESLVINRIEDFSETVGLYAFHNHTPIVEGLELINGKVKDMALSNNASNVFDLRYVLDPNNPAYITNPNILDDKEIIKNLKVEDVDFILRADFQGKIANFRNTSNPTIICKLDGYRNLYASQVISFADAISQSTSKKIKINVLASGEVSDLLLGPLKGLNDDCTIIVKYTDGSNYLITADSNKINGILSLRDKVFDTTEALLFLKTVEGEEYFVKYKDELDDASFKVDGMGVITPYRTSPTFSTTTTNGNIRVYYLNGYTRITNNTGSPRGAASATVLVRLL